MKTEQQIIDMINEKKAFNDKIKSLLYLIRKLYINPFEKYINM